MSVARVPRPASVAAIRLRYGLLGASVFAVLLLVCGAALAAKTYPDRVGDARLSPDIRTVTVSNTGTKITFRLRFGATPALRVSRREGWIDMLLVGIDVPPLGPRPVPEGDWLGMDFGAGFHGPGETGMLVRLGKGAPETKVVAHFRVVTRGSTVTFSIPRRALGSPAWFAFQVAAAREWNDDTEEPTEARPDFVPARATFRYVLAS